MEWYRDGDQQRCRAHETAFALSATCPDCDGIALNQLPPIVDTSYLDVPEPAPDGCLTSIDVERQLVAIATHANASARELLAGTWRGRILGVKLLDVAIKALRAASEHAGTRERRARIARMEKRRDRHRKGQN